MNKRVKTGPLVVIGALALLVGMAVLLTPAPPPPTSEPDAAAHTEEAKTPAKKTTLDLAAVRKLLAADDPHEQEAGIKLLQEGYMHAPAATQTAAIALLKDLVVAGDSERLRVSALGMLRSLKQAETSLCLRLARTDRSPAVRESAIDALGVVADDPQVTAALRSLAQDPDPGIRSVAARALATNLANSSGAGIKDLCALLGVPDNDMAAQIAMRLQQRLIADPSILPVLVETLKTGRTGPQRHGAAMVIALGCAGFNPSIEAFAKAAHVTHRQEVSDRKANLNGLAPLIWALEHDDFAPTREIAAQGLGYLGDARAARPLARALKDPDRLVRRRAAAALITVPAESVVAELAEAATTDQDPAVRQFAVQALGWIHTPAVVPALVKATRDPVAAVRQAAAAELGKLPDDSGLEALMALVGDRPDKDADVRWAAVVALGKLNDRRAEHVLVKCLSDVSPQVQNSAERALQRLGIARREQAGYRS